MNTLGVMILVVLLTAGAGVASSFWQHHVGYEEGTAAEKLRWEKENAKSEAAKEARDKAVADQAKLDAAAVAAALGPLTRAINAGTARAAQPLKVTVAFPPGCKVGPQTVDASNAGR